MVKKGRVKALPVANCFKYLESRLRTISDRSILLYLNGDEHGAMTMSVFWPTELRISRDRHRLSVTFDDGAAFDLSAELLRVLSPSAEVQGHGPGQRVTVPGKRNVQIISVQPTGNYAVRIGFDDSHDTGIYTWTYLRELGEKGEELFKAYEQELADKGMSRDKPEKPR